MFDKTKRTKLTEIIGLRQTPFVQKDGFQEAILTVNSTKANCKVWYKVSMAGLEPYIMPLGTLAKGENQFKVLLKDTNSLLKPNETAHLKIEIFDSNNCTAAPLATYETDKLSRTRHWRFYYSQSMHTDLGYTNYQEELRPLFSVFLDTVKKYIKSSENNQKDLQKYKYVIESGWVMGEGYMHARNADEIQEIADLTADGKMEIGAGLGNHTMECFSTEETARAAYYTNRYLVDKLGISPSTTQRMFDNPAFSKSYVDVAASAGIKYGIHSMNPDRSPYHKKKEYDLFYMQGNNPENRLLIFNGKSYGENYGFGGTHGWDKGGIEDSEQQLLNLIETLEKREGRREYPYDKFLLQLIPFGDNKPPMISQLDTVNALNKKWSENGYIYPKIVSDFPEKFFEAVEKEYGDLIPVETGTEENWWNDGWGTTAFESGMNKRAGAMVSVAETAAGLSALLFGNPYPHEDMDCAVLRNLVYDEHTWGYHSYTGDDMYNHQFEWKRSNAFAAKSLAEKVLNSSLSILASKVQTDSAAIYVYNPLSRCRDDIVTVEDIASLPKCFEIKDGEQSVPYCIENNKLIFTAHNVPALGYKVFAIQEGAYAPSESQKSIVNADFIENKFYRVSFHANGTIKSIIDKMHSGREIVAPASEFNQYRYYDDYGIPFSNMGAKFYNFLWKQYSPKPKDATIEITKTAVSESAYLKTATFRAGSIRQKVTLYKDIPRIDIQNEIVKSPLPSLRKIEEAFYVFPFHAGKSYKIRYDLPVGNALEGEQVYGTSTDWYTAGKWVNVYDEKDDYSMTLAIPDSALLQFGERRTGNWSFDYKSSKPHIYSYILNNMWQTNFQGDQPGYVPFHYSVFTHKGENIGEINHFAQSFSVPLKAVVIKNAQSGSPELQKSFVQISCDNVVLTALKAAEANGDGMIIRFNETAGKSTAGVTAVLPKSVSAYIETDIIENNIGEKQNGNVLQFDIPAYGFKTFRFITDTAMPKVNGVRAVSICGNDNPNLSLKASVTASSAVAEYVPQNAVSLDFSNDWAANKQKDGTLQLDWEEPINIGAVRIAGRANSTDNIKSLKISIGGKKSILVNDMPDDGTPKVIVLDEPVTDVHTVVIFVTGTEKTKNCGLSAVEIYEKAPESAVKPNGTFVSWNKTDGALYYEVFRSKGNETPRFVGAVRGTRLFDKQVNSETAGEYSYFVRACATGIKGAFSDRAVPEAGEIPMPYAYEAPVLHAVPREKQRIDLYWTPVCAGDMISHYEIFRNGRKIGQTSDSYLSSYRDKSVSLGNTYTYSVTAVDKFGSRIESNPIQIAHDDPIFTELNEAVAKRRRIF